jgi:CheY-like chemotaxis protein
MAGIEQVTILMVEDDPGHARLIEKNLRRAHISNPIVTVDDGQKAVDFLFNQGDYANHPHPTPLLVLLDLNIPVVDGYAVLKRMKADEKTRRIPVVILTTTDDQREIAKCYELGCNIYITKPVDYDQFTEAIRQLGLFLAVIKIPNGE